MSVILRINSRTLAFHTFVIDCRSKREKRKRRKWKYSITYFCSAVDGVEHQDDCIWFSIGQRQCGSDTVDKAGANANNIVIQILIGCCKKYCEKHCDADNTLLLKILQYKNKQYDKNKLEMYWTYCDHGDGSIPTTATMLNNPEGNMGGWKRST